MGIEYLTASEWRRLRIRRPFAKLFFLHEPAMLPSAIQEVRVYRRDGGGYGRLVWQVCHACQMGLIIKVAVGDEWGRRGLGTLLVSRALQDGVGYDWTSTLRLPDGELFFPAVAERLGVLIREDAPRCEHIDSAEDARGRMVIDRYLQRAGRRLSLPTDVQRFIEYDEEWVDEDAVD